MIYLASYKPGEGKADRERESRLGRELLSFGLKKEYGRTWEVIAPQGEKPYLSGAPDISFNISHAAGLVACAVSRRQVGVDVERVRPWKESLARRICSPEEYDFVIGGPDMDSGWNMLSGRWEAEFFWLPGYEGGALPEEEAGCEEMNRGPSAPETADLKEKARRERFIRLWTLKESFVKATGQGLKFPLRQITFSWDQEGGIKGSIPGFHFYQSAVYGKYIISVCEGAFLKPLSAWWASHTEERLDAGIKI